MSKCTRNMSEVLNRYEILHNTDDVYIGDKVALFYESKFGRYPYYQNYNLSIPINSGTPQNVSTEDLNRHVEIALHNISDHIKCANSSGLGVVDFEEWRPLYDINSVKKEVYKLAAIKLTKEKYQSMNSSEVNKTAVVEYDEAAKEFLLITLRNATNERNKTLWGMYGFPYCNYDAGTLKNLTQPPSLEDYRCMDRYQKFNDRMQYIFNASQALYPSIYLNNRTDYHRNFRYVQAIMAETLRVAQNYSPPLPIYVYSKFEYDPVKELCSFYTKVEILN
uniref:Hyaluronidase n=1 Tax=Haemonchus contortus TaxID=6289 RepID=A0A7I5E826_HAECO